MSTLKTKAKPKTAPAEKVARADNAPASKVATAKSSSRAPASRSAGLKAAAKPAAVKKSAAKPEAAKPAEAKPVPDLPQEVATDVLAQSIPKAFLALAVDAGIFLLGALPERASKITGLGYFKADSDTLELCCVPAKGGVLQVDNAPFAKIGKNENEIVREQKYLAFLPIPAKLLEQSSSLHFGVVQEDGLQTRFPIDVIRLQALEVPMRESVMREYRHLFAPAVSAMLPPEHPLKKAGGSTAAVATPAAATPAATTPAATTPATAAPATAAPAKAAKPAPAAAAAPRQQGFFDEIVEGRAEGWAFDPANPKQRLIVEIMEGKRVVARGIADRFRDDLLNAGIGDGRYCYKLPVSHELRDGKPHQLTARVARTGQALQVKGGGDSHLFELPPVDTTEFDLIPSTVAVQLAVTLAGGLKDPEAQKELVLAFGNANLALDMRELTEAARGFLDLLPKFGEQPLFFCKVAETYLLAGRNQDAVRAYQKATECGADFGWSWLGLGGAQRLLEAWPEAEAAYKKSADLMPQLAQAKSRLADVRSRSNKTQAQSLLKDGKREQAVAMLKAYLLHSPDDEDGWNMLEQALCAPAKNGASDPLDDKELRAFEAARQMLDLVLDAAEAMTGTRK